MPIISRVGRNSFRVRFAYGVIFCLLSIGAITMIYPLLLMLSGSVKSMADFSDITPYPRYLWNDDVLWQKYVESKYANIREAEKAYRHPSGNWRRVAAPGDLQPQLVNEFQEFRSQFDWPTNWYIAGHARNIRLFRQEAQERYDHDIDAYARAVSAGYRSWSQVIPPVKGTVYATRIWSHNQGPHYDIYDELKTTRPGSEWYVVDLDAVYWATFLLPQWPNIATYNAAHGTNFDDYTEVLLHRTPPREGQQRKDWEEFVRTSLNLGFVRIAQTPALMSGWQKFLSDRYTGKLADLNSAWGTKFADWKDAPLPADMPSVSARQRNDLRAFVKDPAVCPLDALSIYGPRQAFEEFVAKNRGVDVASVGNLPLPIEASDWQDFHKEKGSWRWEFVTSNFRTVIDYLLLHGNGFRNTVIYCVLAVLTHLIVNPLAAYALSRYKPPAMYTILLFCMATMAFPHEVTMIPAFLLLKRFPFVPIIIGLIAGLLSAWFLHRTRPETPAWMKGILSGVIGLAVGYWLAPLLAQQFFGRPDANVSLLNTFWALVLPGLANGYSIFLLKGFFDSLPKELYEAAELDGAGEWIKFWHLTMSLSKPILAVLALGAFTHAYSEFMMALVIIPDPNMWTIMVWLFQFQSQPTTTPPEVYASLVIAAIPTMLIFLFCQKLIMRGIVVPSEK